MMHKKIIISFTVIVGFIFNVTALAVVQEPVVQGQSTQSTPQVSVQMMPQAPLQSQASQSKASHPKASPQPKALPLRDPRIEKIVAQTNKLQKEVRVLTTELNQMKAEERARKVKQHKRARKIHRAHRRKVRRRTRRTDRMRVGLPRVRVYKVRHSRNLHRKLFSSSTAFYYQHHLPTVITSPHLGLRSAYDASDLIVNLPTVNEDLRLLRNRYKFEKTLQGQALYYKRPVVEFSGKIEGIVSNTRSFSGKTSNDINLLAARLDTLIEASPWALGFMSFTYDPTFLDPAVTGFGARVHNSRLFLERGFITIGKLDTSDFYFSLGQMYANFGRYSTMMLTAPMTLVLGRTNERILNLGFADVRTGLGVSVYTFRGATHTGNPGVIHQGGVNVVYKTHVGKLAGNVGAGYIANIADSQGMQQTGNALGTFQGFSQTTGTELIVRKVPGIDVHGEFAYGPLNFAGEYVGTLRRFNPADITFNGLGARMQTMHVEADYHFKLFRSKPAALGFAYEHSWQALALNIPAESYIFLLSASLWKDTIETIEFRHDTNYKATDMSAGRCSVGGGVIMLCPVPVTGRTRNTVLLQIGVYL